MIVSLYCDDFSYHVCTCRLFVAFLGCFLKPAPYSLHPHKGVSDIQTNVEAKSVVVVHDESVSKEVMLEKLQKWSAASGKSVALAS